MTYVFEWKIGINSTARLSVIYYVHLTRVNSYNLFYCATADTYYTYSTEERTEAPRGQVIFIQSQEAEDRRMQLSKLDLNGISREKSLL